MAEDVIKGFLDLTSKIIVRSEAGLSLFEVRFDEAVQLKHPDHTGSKGQG